MTFEEWIAAIEKSFLMNKLMDKGPIDMNGALREAYVELSKDNYRGKATITWRLAAHALALCLDLLAIRTTLTTDERSPPEVSPVMIDRRWVR